MPISIRFAEAEDEDFLWDMLYFAAHMHEDGEISAEEAKGNPFLAPYVAGWGQEGDLGVVAVDEEGGLLVGACWLRLVPGEAHRYASVPEEYPELAIATLPEYAGQGIGSRLLAAILPKAAENFPGIVLSVREGNPAQRLYERFGFQIVDEITNRVGGRSWVMVLKFGE